MFNFEEWSEKVFHLIDRIDENRAAGKINSKIKEEVNELWQEMQQHQNDESVQFLNILLTNTRNLLDGKMNGDEFEEEISKMRDKAFHIEE